MHKHSKVNQGSDIGADRNQRYCSSCEYIIDENVAFCGHCGVQVSSQNMSANIEDKPDHWFYHINPVMWVVISVVALMILFTVRVTSFN